MYLVELRPGKEELYRSVDELAAAIRSGDVDVHSRIFHRATSKWISITLHPQFKAISAAREQEVAEPRKQWTFLMSAADELGPGQAPEVNTTEHVERPTSPASDENTPRGSGSWRRPFTLGFTGVLVIVGVQLALSAPRPQWAKLGALLPSSLARPTAERGASVSSAASKSPAATHQDMVGLTGATGWQSVGYPLPPEAAFRTTHAAGATRRLSSMPVVAGSAPSQADAAESDAGAPVVDSLIQEYETAYGDARNQLTAAWQAVDFREVFEPARLASTDGLARARTSVVGAREAVQAYRVRTGEIERMYHDTFAVSFRELGLPPRQVLRWYARPRHTETTALKALSEALLATADSALDVLAANEGAYRVSDDTIEFDRPEAAAAYGRLRQQLDHYLDSARGEQARDSSSVVALLLDDSGIAALPVEGSR